MTKLIDNGTIGNKALASTLTLLDSKQKIAVVSQLSLTESQKLGILATSGLSADELKAAISTDIFTTSETANISITEKLSLAWQGLAAKLGISVTALNVAVAGIAALSIGVMVYKQYQQAQEESRQAAQDAANTYADSTKSIEGYTKRYEELHTALLAAKGNEEETYSIKKQLLDLQTELNDKFGDEYGRLNLVTDAYKDQTDVIKSYNKEAAKALLNDISRSEQNESVRKMTTKNHYNLNSGELSGYSDESLALQELIKKYEGQGITSDIDESSGMLWIHLNADPASAEETINSFMTDVSSLANKLGDEHIFDEVLEMSKYSKDDARNTISDWGDIYEKTLLGNIALDDNLSAGMEKATQSVQNYNEAVLKSEDPYNDENVQKAYDDLQKIKGEIQNDDSWDKYSTVINGVWDSADTKLYDLKANIESNQDGIGQFVNKIKGIDNLDLKAKLDSHDTDIYETLTSYAKKYGISIDELIDVLTTLGYIQSQAVNNTPEIDPVTKSDAIAKVKELSEGFEALDKIMSSINNDDTPFDHTLLYDKNFKENFQDLGDSYTDFIETISNSPKDIATCQSAFDKLVTSFLNQKGITEILNEDTKGLVASMLENMGVANAEAVVTDYLAQKQAALAAEKYYNANASDFLVDGTLSEYSAFLNEADGAEVSRLALAQLELSKIAVNGVKIDTSSDIDQIINIANAAGASATVLAKLAHAKAIYAKAESQGLNGSIGDLRMLESADRTMDEISNGDFDWDLQFDPNDFKSVVYGSNPSVNGSKSDSGGENSNKEQAKEEVEKEFNWIERRSELLKKQHDLLKETADDETSSYNERISAIQNLIDNDKKRAGFASDAATQYQEAWETASEKLSEEEKKLIEEGGLNTDPYTGQKAEDIQTALDAYDDMKEYSAQEAAILKEVNEHLRDQVKLREEIIKAQQDSVQSEMDMLQSRMDYTEARGGILTAGMFKEQIALSKELSRSYDDQIDNLYEQLKLVDEDSAEYYSLQAQINDCENAIIQCKTEQAGWNEQIMRLPVERLQKYLNGLSTIKQDLQNFLDEQSVMGINPTAEQLQQLFDISQEEISSLLKQQSELKNLLSEYKYGSEKFNDVSQEIQDIDDGISSLIQDQKDLNAQMLQIPVDRFEKLNDTLNTALGTIDDVIGEYDTALSAVTSTIDKQIDSVNELKDAIDEKKEAIEEEKKAAEESYQDRIDPIQEELDILNKQNEARKIQLSLEQAKYNLDKARDQRTNKVIRNGEIVYESDQDEIKNAENGLADAQLEKIKYDSEEVIKALEEARDKELEAFDEKLAAYDKDLEGLDSEIERLNEIKDRWSSIKDEIQLAADTAKADGLFGSGWQDKLLSGNDGGMFTGFKELYEGILSQKSQYEEQTASNERIADMMNQFITKYQDGSITYEQAMAGIKDLSAQMKDGYSALEYLSNIMGINGSTDLSSLLENMQDRADDAVGQLGDYMNLVEQNSTVLDQYTKTWDEMKQNITEQIEALKKAAEALEHMSNDGADRNPHGSSGGGSNDSGKNNISSGTIHADGSHTINDPSVPGDYTGNIGPSGEKAPEYVNSGPGAAYDKIEKDHGGVTSGFVGNTSNRQRVLDAFKHLTTKDLKPNEVPIIAQANELVLTSEQQNTLLNNLRNASNMSQIIPVPSFSSASGSGASVTVNLGDITLPNVKDGDGFAKAIEQTFEPTMKQYFSKVFRD